MSGSDLVVVATAVACFALVSARLAGTWVTKILERSVPWYRRLFGTEPVLDEDTGPFRHVVWSLGDTLVGLHEFPEGTSDSSFDERRPGLDHLSFACTDRSHLEQWQQHLNELGIEHGGVVDAGYGSGLSFRDPDNIALEFFAPPS